jgi:hypothetical protein
MPWLTATFSAWKHELGAQAGLANPRNRSQPAGSSPSSSASISKGLSLSDPPTMSPWAVKEGRTRPSPPIRGRPLRVPAGGSHVAAFLRPAAWRQNGTKRNEDWNEREVTHRGDALVRGRATWPGRVGRPCLDCAHEKRGDADRSGRIPASTRIAGRPPVLDGRSRLGDAVEGLHPRDRADRVRPHDPDSFTLPGKEGRLRRQAFYHIFAGVINGVAFHKPGLFISGVAQASSLWMGNTGKIPVLLLPLMNNPG